MKKLFTIILTIFAAHGFAQAPVMNAINGPTAVCSSPSSPLSFSTSASNSPTSYSWTVVPSSSVTITNATNSVTSISFPYSTGTYTIYCYATNGSGSSPTQSFVVTVFETPTITFSGANTFCQGSSTNLSASSTILAASPTIFYNWSPASSLNTSSGPNVVAFPIAPTVYTVTATKGICSNTGTISVTPLNSPTVTANVGYVSICAGSQYTLFGNGALTYTWTNNVSNNVPFTPTATNGYIVTGTGANGCTDTAFAQITVNPLPTFTVASSASVLCLGQGAATISINGTGSSYSVNGNPSPATFTIMPTGTTSYTIRSITSSGCFTAQVFTQVVSTCIGLKENSEIAHGLSIYPNPNYGTFTIKSDVTQQAHILNSLGQLVRTTQLAKGENKISDLTPGVYIIQTQTQRIKIVVSN
jgi:hypothetical protein